MRTVLRTQTRRLLAGAAAAMAALLVAASTWAAPEKVAGGIRFTYRDPNASSVAWAGDFNSWSTTASVMQRDPEGVWSVVLPLPPGTQAYKFVVDGQWLADPENGVTTGEFGNSVVKIGSDGNLVSQTATSNTSYSPKITIEGRVHSLFLNIFDPTYSRYELSRPLFDIDLGFGVRISDVLRAHVLTNINPQKEDVQDYRSRLNYKRGSLEFEQPDLRIFAFDSETLPTWDDPARLVGGIGVFDHPFGDQRSGFQVTTPKWGFETRLLYADNSAVGGNEFPGGSTAFQDFSIDRGTNRRFVFDATAVDDSWKQMRTVRRDSVTFVLAPNQVSKFSTTDVGDGGGSFGFGNGAEDVFAASIRRRLGQELTLGALGRSNRGFHLGRFVLAQATGDTTGTIFYGQSQQEFFAVGGEARWAPTTTIDAHAEVLAGVRRLDLMDRGTRLDFTAQGIGGSGITSITTTSSVPLGQHFNLDEGARVIAGGSWTFASGDVTLAAEVEHQSHRYPAWSQPPVAPAGLANVDHPRFENVDFQRAVYLDDRDLENRMLEWRFRWDRNWRYYLGREVKTSIGLELTDFHYDPRTTWEYQLWFPTGNMWLEQEGQVVGIDRLTLLGEDQAYRVRPALEVPIRRARQVVFRYRGDLAGVKLGLRPRYAESVFQLGFDLTRALRFTNDTRWVKYDAPALRLDRSYISQFSEVVYRFSDRIHIGLGYGIDPWVLDPVTNEFAPIGRDVYLNDRNANGFVAENDWLSLAPQLSAAEKALQNERRIQIEAVVHF